ADRAPHVSELSHRGVARRTGAEGRPELPRERPAVEACGPLEFCGRVGRSWLRVQQRPGAFQGRNRQRRSRRPGSRSLKQEIGYRRDDLRERNIVEDIVQIPHWRYVASL